MTKPAIPSGMAGLCRYPSAEQGIYPLGHTCRANAFGYLNGMLKAVHLTEVGIGVCAQQVAATIRQASQTL